MPNFRVTFSKDNVLVYISHLDLNHAFIRALNRAGIKLKFSEGFNPHPKIVFALPLSVGMEGENEIVDIGVADEEMSQEQFLEILRSQMPPHIEIKNVEITQSKLKDISAASYEIFISGRLIAAELKSFFEGDISVLKKTKSGEKQVMISPQIRSISISEKDNDTIINAVLDARADSYLNPELILKAITEKGLISAGDTCKVKRKKILLGSDIKDM